jgi:hypothetical protein
VLYALGGRDPGSLDCTIVNLMKCRRRLASTWTENEKSKTNIMEKKDSSLTQVYLYVARQFLHVADEMRTCWGTSSAPEAGAKHMNLRKHK